MFQVTWADDLAILAEFEHAAQIENRLALIAYVLLQKLPKYGMKVSIGETKTAAVVSPRGPGAVSMRRRLFAVTNATFPILLEDTTVRLPLVPKYRHLGGIIDASGSLLPEIRTRFSKARSAFWRAAKHVFRQQSIPLATRMTIFRSTVMSIMTWGAGAWTELNQREGQAWTASLWNLYAMMLPRSFLAPSRVHFWLLLGMTFDVSLHVKIQMTCCRLQGSDILVHCCVQRLIFCGHWLQMILVQCICTVNHSSGPRLCLTGTPLYRMSVMELHGKD